MRRVEAHFGTGIASLFAFEQNIIWLNFWMALLWGAFVNIPWAVNRPQRFIDTDVKYKGIVGLDGMETSWFGALLLFEGFNPHAVLDWW